jgi:hypothetical protein
VTRSKVMTGQRFNRLVAIRQVGVRHGHADWLFRCDCGAEKVIPGYRARNRNAASCGCHRREQCGTMSRTHGETHSVEYTTWTSMTQRCFNPRNRAYKDYGGRGITVCERWRTSFEAFLADMGRRPAPGLSLDRIDNNHGYEPWNCRWATKFEQNNNKRRATFIRCAHCGVPIPAICGPCDDAPLVFGSAELADEDGVVVEDAA